MNNTPITPHTMRYTENGYDFDIIVKQFNLSKERDSLRSRFSWQGYKKTIEEIIDEFEQRPSRSWKDGEIEKVAIAYIEIDQFSSTVYFWVKCPPVQGGIEPDHKIFKAVRMPTGNKKIGAVGLPLTSEGKIILTHQYKLAAECWMLELPRGLKDRNKEVDNLEAARRIVSNEIGADIPEGTGTIIGETRGDTGAIMGITEIVLFRNVSYDTNKIRARRDKTHSEIHVEEYTPAEIIDLISQGQITCGFTLAAIMHAISKGVIKT